MCSVIVAVLKMKNLLAVLTTIGIFLSWNIFIRWNNSRCEFIIPESALVSQISSRCYNNQNFTTKQRHIGYLKTHKCASSTLQNIFFRFALKYDLNLVLPQKNNYLGKGEKFKRSLISNVPWRSLEYHLFALHTSWNQKEVEETIGNKEIAKFVTILRDPVEQFESMFYYLKLAPFYNVTDLEDFVWNAMNGSRRIEIFGRNQMLYDSGLSMWDFDDEAAILKHIRKMEEDFDLVMIVENFYESLILLKELLKWDFEDVIPVYKNGGINKKISELSPKARNRLRSWLHGDQLLYDHFKNILERKKSNYGVERLSNDVEELKQLADIVDSVCKRPNTRSLVLYGSPCRSFTIDEISFIDFFRTKQRTKCFSTF